MNTYEYKINRFIPGVRYYRDKIGSILTQAIFNNSYSLRLDIYKCPRF